MHSSDKLGAWAVGMLTKTKDGSPFVSTAPLVLSHVAQLGHSTMSNL